MPERHLVTRIGWLRAASLLFLALLDAVGAKAGRAGLLRAPGC